MFYLQSRGIGLADARNLLIYAFARDIVDRIKVASLRDQLEKTVAGETPWRLATKTVARDQASRENFPVLDQRVHGKPLVYLDNAATTQKPQMVLDAMNQFYQVDNSNIHRGVHELSERSTRHYEEARVKIQRFLNAADWREIIFVRGATEGINLVAYTYGRRHVQAGDEIVISAMEHHSNIVPWQILCEEKQAILRIAPINQRGELLLDEFEKLLNPRTKLVSVVHVSNALGTINPVAEIARMAHRHGAPVFIDGAQAVAHMKVDVQALDCDFYALSGHKMFGPTGIGVLYGKAELLNKMPPYQGGGDMISSVTFAKTTYNELPYKFEAGTPNIAGTIGLGAAVDYINGIGLDRIASLRARAAGLWHRAVGAHSRPAPDRHGAREGQRAFVCDGRRASARCRHHPRPRGRGRAHRPSLRPAGDGVVRRARHHARVAGVLQHHGRRSTRWWPASGKVKEIFG